MSRNKMRTSYIAFGTLATLAAALAACSGGGGSATSPSVNSNIPAPPTSFGTSVTGPTGTVKVSVVIPQRPALPAALATLVHNQHGPKHADAHIRSMANTSPTASVRAIGAQINRYAAQFEGSNRRGAQYVSAATYYMELVVTDAANDSPAVVDKAVQCSSTSCNGSYGVPVGTNYNVSLFLYDDCDYLLSVGTASGVNVTQGATTQVPITLNGVAAYVAVAPNPGQTPLIADASEAQTFNVGVSLVDADYNVITTPGQPVDESLKAISQISLAVDDGIGNSPTDVTPALGQTITVSPLAPGASPVPYNYTTSNYTYAGTGSEKNVRWSATTTSGGSPVVPSVANGACYNYPNPTTGCGPYTPPARWAPYGSNEIAVSPVQLIFTNPEAFPNPTGSPGYYPPGQGNLNPLPTTSPSSAPSSNPSSNPTSGPGNGNGLFIPQFSQVSASLWALEFPNLQDGGGNGYVGLQEVSLSGTVVPFAGTVTLTDNEGCSGVVTYPQSAFGFTAGNANVVLGAFNLSSPNSSCTITATDTVGRIAQLEFFFDNPSLTIQSHARSAK